MKEIDFVKITHEDLEIIRNWRNSIEVSQFMYTDDYITRENQLKWFSKISNLQDSFYWLIKFKNFKIGLVSITDIDKINSSCNWAFYIGDEDYRNIGAGVKTEFLLIERVFNNFNLEILNCEVISTNFQVLNLHKKFGFKEVSYNKNHIKKNNVFYDVIKLTLYKKDWLHIKNKLSSIINK